jgi:peptide chain release factor
MTPFLIQISSGRGPAECELAVGLYLEWLKSVRPEIEVLETHGHAVVNCLGRRLETYRSVVVAISGPYDLPLGTILWRVKSPLRPHHGRRNWYFQTSLLSERPESLDPLLASIERDVKFTTFRSPGHGGQNVNKVETGVRATHKPSGLVATATTARTQLANKNLATARLKQKLAELGQDSQKKISEEDWRRHDQLERGQPKQIFTGPKFLFSPLEN